MPHEGQEGVTFSSAGRKLVGTLFLARGDDPKPTVLLLHGIPGVEKNYDIAHALRDVGWNALVFHYRGCWGSEGAYRFSNLKDDALAALAYLRSGAHPQVDGDRVVLIGHSGGGQTAILAGAEDPTVRGVAVYGAPADLRWFEIPAAWLDANWIPWLNGVTGVDLIEDIARSGDALSAVEHVAKIPPRPLLIVHGDRDEVVPIRDAIALAERGGVELRRHPEANHSFAFYRPWLRDQLMSWIEGIS